MTQAPQAASSGPLDPATPETAPPEDPLLLKPADVSIVRIAQPEDIEGLMALARAMHQEVGMFPLAEDKVRAEIMEAIKAKLVGVVGHPEVHGCMCLKIGEAWYTRTRQANEFMFFVHPDQLADDVLDRRPCRYALRETLRHLRQTSKFLPSIAEVLASLDKAQKRVRATAWHIGQLPSEIEKARAALAEQERRAAARAGAAS